MAISLSNHEDRIKKLEDNSSSGNVISLYKVSGESQHKQITLSQPYTNFNMLIIGFHEDTGVYQGPYLSHTTMTICVNDIQLNQMYACGNPITGDSNSGNAFIFTSTTNITEKHWSIARCGLVSVYGLKLYYSFSYNIIYRILLRKISSLVKKLHFNLFEMSSRRGGVNYGY